MKYAAYSLAILMTATPAYAQLGGIGKRLGQAKDAHDKVADLNISEQDERKLGEEVSALVRKEFGVVQDAAVTKYVTLVGTMLTQASTRPALKWEFIVLDTDGVNAFAAPGGIVHITNGALGLIKSEGELAGVLGHEVAQVNTKQTKN
jgi:predicted Zn-dependent protease